MSFILLVRELLGSQFAGQIIAFLLTTVGTVAIYFLRSRVRLFWAQTNHFIHRLGPKPTSPGNASGEGGTVPAQPALPITVHTASYIVKNAGRAIATDVEFVLNYKPDEISVWSQRLYKIEENPEGRQVVCFQTLAPKEICTVNIITIGRDLPVVLNLRSREAAGRHIEVYPQQKFSRWVYLTVWLFILFGVYFVLERLIGFLLLVLSSVSVQ